MNNISSLKDCYGCGVCATVCSQKIISLSLNVDGFYVPSVAGRGCTECGLCISVCAYNDDSFLQVNSNPQKAYAAWSKDSQIRGKCSSGGISFEIGRHLLEKGYKVCGVRYNVKKNRAEHYIASNLKELMFSIGSKYIQSYTVDGFAAVNKKEKYLITGTPCQIDSFRRYIRKFKVEDNFVLMDFFCHSVPSMWAWRKYIQMVECKIGKITNVSWRNKQTGWHDSYSISIDGEKVDRYDDYNILMRERKNGYNSRLSQGDLFYRLFLGDYCCNPVCRVRCKYKYNRSAADIRIGDLWGKTYKDNKEGVSALVAFTSKGDILINQLEGCELIKHSFEIVAEGQMKKNVGKAYFSSLIMHWLKSDIIFPMILWKTILSIENLLHLPRRVMRKLIK